MNGSASASSHFQELVNLGADVRCGDELTDDGNRIQTDIKHPRTILGVMPPIAPIGFVPRQPGFGEPPLRNFDISKEAGGENRALDRTFHGLQANAQGN